MTEEKEMLNKCKNKYRFKERTIDRCSSEVTRDTTLYPYEKIIGAHRLENGMWLLLIQIDAEKWLTTK